MQGIHDIFITFNGVCSRLFHILAPVGCAHQNNAVPVILPDHFYDLLRIALHITPCRSPVRLITYLIKYIDIVGILLRHFPEKFLGILQISIGVSVRQNMPVYNDIHIILRGILHPVFHQCLQVLLIAPGTVPAVFRSIHGQPEHIHPPFLFQLPDAFFVHIIGIPCQSVGADPLQLNRIAAAVHQLCPVHGKGTHGGVCAGDFQPAFSL